MSHRTRRRRFCLINGPAVRHIRTVTGLTGAGLAREIGVDPDYIYKIENGVQRRVRPDMYDRILHALRIEDHRVLLVDPWVERDFIT